ncbi:MAG: N-6 DNA methylase [Acidimicrobiaceae bacterium]|nr:N-6 DNA methylase [Acidimicrobiaceae bacterium]
MTAGAISTVGGLLTGEFLERLDRSDPALPSLKPTDFELAPSERLRDAVTRSWNRLAALWTAFKREEQALPDTDDSATRLTRERWLLPLLSELGFAGLDAVQSLAPGSDGKTYAISHEWRGRVPVHLMGWRTPIDRRTPGLPGAAKASPHGLLQEFLNSSDAHLWGVVSNGRVLRLLRDNASLTRQAYVEFDLTAIFDGEAFADFTLLWLCCHRTRFEGDTPARCPLEQWRKEAAVQGTRAREKLRSGVEQAIVSLGNGALAHRANSELRARLRSGELTADDLQRQLLRVVYRMLFLLVAESRSLLLAPNSPADTKDRYERFYSMRRLCRLASARRGGAHSDLWQALGVTMAALDIGDEPPQRAAREALGLTSLGSLLWSQDEVADLAAARIDNAHLLEAVRHLAFVHDDEARLLRPVDYQNLGTEELGSVYESLLELHAVVDPEDRSFGLGSAAGSERKTTGSYYTPPELISKLLDEALDPVIAEAKAKPEPEQALLDLKVLDPACGSGHFLIAAAHRIADALASVREGGTEPSPEGSRAALREVVGSCLYAIDINPMAVELCKVSLWLESNTPGKPLNFLDHRIICGNSLLGTTPRLLAGGIPDTAFKHLTGDDKAHVSALRKANKKERKDRSQGVLAVEWSVASEAALLASGLHRIDVAEDDTAEQVAAKQVEYARLRALARVEKAKLIADAWCAAFVARKTPSDPPITDRTFRTLQSRSPDQLVVDISESRQNDTSEKAAADIDSIRRLADEYQFTHLHLAFPNVFEVPEDPDTATNAHTGWSGGFDAILSNPPWERVKLQEKEFFSQHDETIAAAPTAAARKRLIADLKASNPTLRQAFKQALRQAEGTSALLRSSGRFPLAGRGDVNTYAVFAELMANGVSPTGHVGTIVPTGIATDDTTKHLFGHLVENSRLVSFYDFENRRSIFPAVHRSFKFCLLTLTGTERSASRATFAFFAHEPSDLDEDDRRFMLGPQDFSLLNPNTKTCPIFRSTRDAEITTSIYRRLPILIDEHASDGNPWNVSFRRMFDMTNDSGLFRDRETLEAIGLVLEGNRFVCPHGLTPNNEHSTAERYLPLYEGKMATFYDHRASDVFKSLTATTRQNQPRYLTPTQKQDAMTQPLPLYWIDEETIRERMDSGTSWLLGFNDVTSVANERTMVCSALPSVAVGNSEPLLIVPMYAHLVLAIASSFVFDYTARQKVGGNHMNYIYLKQLPLLTQEMVRYHEALITDSALELVYTAWDMEPFGLDLRNEGPPFRWDDARRALIRAEIDALMFHLYGVSRADAGYIMDTFPIIRRKDEEAHGEFRTKRLVLDRYDAMTAAFEAKHRTLAGTPNGPNPPLDEPSLATYSRLLADALAANYRTNIDPPPAHPSQAHPASTRPSWASPNSLPPSRQENRAISSAGTTEG